MGHLHKQHLLRDAQHGFLGGWLCLDNLFSTLKLVARQMDDSEDVGMFFPDFIQALDVSKHHFLCVKLATLGMPPLVVGKIRSYLTKCKFQTHIGCVVYVEAAVHSDVSQGSVIGPFIFLVMANDLLDGNSFSGRFLLKT